MKRAAFLDRDGVINESLVIKGLPRPPLNIDELNIIEGVVEAINILIKYDFIPVVITNQPDVARGTNSLDEIIEIHKKISEITGIRYFYSCTHDDFNNCICRKPKPGLVLRAASELNIDVSKSFLVGDRWRDIALGQILGLESYFIDYRYSELPPKKPYIKVDSLLEAVKNVVRNLNDSKYK